MELITQVLDDARVLRVAGNFDKSNSPAVQRWLDNALHVDPTYLVINLADVSFLDSTALSTLVQGKKRAVQKQGDLVLCGLQHPVRMIFELTRLDRVFDIYPSENEAVRAYSQ